MEVMIKEGAEKRLNDASERGADGDAATLSGISKICVRSAAKKMLIRVSFAICAKDARADKSRWPRILVIALDARMVAMIFMDFTTMRLELKEKGIHLSWERIRNFMATQQRVTLALPTDPS